MYVYFLEQKTFDILSGQNGLVTSIFQNIIFYVLQKNSNHTGLEQLG